MQLELTTDAVTRVMEAVGLLLSHFDHGTKHQGDEVRCLSAWLRTPVSELCCGRFLPVDWR